MYLSEDISIDLMKDRLHSHDWGIWGKEKYTYSEDKQREKHLRESALLMKLLKGCPERLKVALRYSYGICGLDAYSLPISESEFHQLSRIYKDAITFALKIPDEGMRDLYTELYCIHFTAKEINGFEKGLLVNETSDQAIWRKYIYLDFFKFSCINMLMRESITSLGKLSDQMFTSRLLLAYYLGTGSLLDKATVFFSKDEYQAIIIQIELFCKKLELTPEFPDIQYQLFIKDYLEILNNVRQFRNQRKNAIQLFHEERYKPFLVCNNYYEKYLGLNSVEYEHIQEDARQIDNPLKAMIKLHDQILSMKSFNSQQMLHLLRIIRNKTDEAYGNKELFQSDLNITNVFSITTHPFFQALLYEGKILSLLFRNECPEYGDYIYPLFEELVPFYSIKLEDKRSLLSFETNLDFDLPQLTLAHHVHNANCEKLHNKMIINKLLIWDQEKIKHIVSSSSSLVEIALKERELCRKIGFNYYRIHARQHLKAGNQNRAIPNIIEGVGKEYYLTMDDDYFSFPDYALIAHKKIVSEDLDYLQAPLIFKGLYDNVTHAEKADAESMLFFEATYGRNVPRYYVFPRGTSTIFNFIDGNNSFTDTGGFLVDFSSEDFGQGYLALIQQCSSLFGKKKSSNTPGQITERIHVIGEGVDLNGKIKQMERWMQGSGQVFFHLLLPALIKSLIKGERNLILNKQFSGTFFLTASGIAYRFIFFILLCYPLLFSALINAGYLPGKFHASLIIPVIIFNFLVIFTMFFIVINKVSILAALRLVLIEPIITVPAVIGYLKGIFKITPKKWVANKSGKLMHSANNGIYFLLLLNTISIISLRNIGIWQYFWALFNSILIFSGFIILNWRYKPKIPVIRFERNPTIVLWIILFIISSLLTTLYFVLEFNFEPVPLKILVLLIMLFTFVMSFKMMFLNIALVCFQKKAKRLNLKVL